MRVAGVDGCRGGWAVATLADGLLRVSVVDSFAALTDYDVVGVDIPIGLSAAGPRACDVEARRRLGPRRSSVFPAPVRRALGCSTWESAMAVRPLSRQAFGLFAKVREVDGLWRPGVHEVHPELSLAVMTGAPMRSSKRTAEGRAERLAALDAAFGSVPREPVRGAAGDDVLDACAVLWSALRIARGAAERVGDGALDALGRPMAIWV